MSKQLTSLGDLAKALTLGAVAAMVSAERGLAKAAQLVQEDAKDRIGHYQGAVGPFPDWAPLADATEADKAAKGYPLGAPLLREGDLRDSIVTETNITEAVIGSKMDIAAYQEFGTTRIPPRPFLGPAAFENRDKIQRIIGSHVVAGLSAGVAVNPSLGYDAEVR
jgi:HK97 gp10 family phage protein